MKLTLVLVMAVLSLAVGCGSSEDEPMTTPTTPTGGPDPMVVRTLADRAEPASDISVVGYVVAGPAGASLCDVLLESDPPQCGPVSVEIIDFENLGIDFREEQGVRWTENKVAFRGRWEDGVFSATSLLQ